MNSPPGPPMTLGNAANAKVRWDTTLENSKVSAVYCCLSKALSVMYT